MLPLPVTYVLDLPFSDPRHPQSRRRSDCVWRSKAGFQRRKKRSQILLGTLCLAFIGCWRRFAGCWLATSHFLRTAVRTAGPPSQRPHLTCIQSGLAWRIWLSDKMSRLGTHLSLQEFRLKIASVIHAHWRQRLPGSSLGDSEGIGTHASSQRKPDNTRQPWN